MCNVFENLNLNASQEGLSRYQISFVCMNGSKVTVENVLNRLGEVGLTLTKLMVSHDLSHSTVTNQIAFDQQDLHSTPEFERAMDRRCQGLVSKLETLDTITFT